MRILGTLTPTAVPYQTDIMTTIPNSTTAAGCTYSSFTCCPCT